MYLFPIVASVATAGVAIGLAGVVPGILITLVLGLVALLIWFAFDKQWQELGNVGQGLLGFASVIALIVAALLYYEAGRDRARIEAEARATIVPFSRDERGVPRVLVQVAGTVTNRGETRLKFDCVGVDVRGFRSDRRISRNGVFHYDVNTEALLTETAKGDQWQDCVQQERDRWNSQENERLQRLSLPEQARRQFYPPNSGHRYDPFELSIGESRTLDLELVIPCTYAALRLHFLVPRPDAAVADEAKAVYSIVEECSKSAQPGGFASGGGGGGW